MSVCGSVSLQFTTTSNKPSLSSDSLLIRVYSHKRGRSKGKVPIREGVRLLVQSTTYNYRLGTQLNRFYYRVGSPVETGY